MKTNLMTACRQWQYRPADERFWTLTELFERTKEYAEQSTTCNVGLAECEIAATDTEDLVLIRPDNGQSIQVCAEFQHYSFNQFAGICQAPAAYLRTLPAHLAADCLNNGLSRVSGEQTLMLHQNGGLHLRCVTSGKYARIWNWEVAEMALALEENDHWRVPPARPSDSEGVLSRIATSADVLSKSAHAEMGIKVGDVISPAGLYASDHDCFIFQVNEDRSIDGGDGETLYRGVFWSNSEVGAARFRGTMFLYESICGNHIVWGAKDITEISIRHTGNAREAFAEAMASVTGQMERSKKADVDRIKRAKMHNLGSTKEAIVELVFRKQVGLTRGECESAYVLATRHEDQHGHNPNSAWGYAAGITRLSQQKYADDRDRMDRAAGRILEMAQ